MIKRITCQPYRQGEDQRMLFIVEFTNGNKQTIDRSYSGQGTIKLLTGRPNEAFEVLMYRSARTGKVMVSVHVTFGDGSEAHIEREYLDAPLGYEFVHEEPN